MNVLFVNPPRDHMVRFALGSDNVLYGNYQPPLGLMYVATNVDHKTDHNVQLIDLDIAPESMAAIVPKIEAFPPDVVALTSYTYTLYDTYETCRLIKKLAPDCKIVFGGAHVDIYPYETFEQPFVDLLVKGEGEETMIEVLEYFAGQRRPETIKGIYYRHAEDGRIEFTGERGRITDVDAIPFPDRSMLDDDGYFSHLNPNFRETTMVTSRGCPYKCNFCNVGETRYHYRSPQNIVDEMAFCVEQGYNFIQFVDDTFNLFDKKIKEMCRELIRRDLPLKWSFRGRVDKVDAELCELLVQADCIRAYFGVESGNPEVLASIGKGITVDQTRNAFKLMKEHKIETVGYFMIGFPEETPAQIEDTVRFAAEIETDFAQVLITTPLPETRLYKQALAEGGIPGDYMREYALNPVPNLQMVPWNKHMSTEELVIQSKRFYRRFYFRPRYIWRELRRTADLTAFWRKFTAFISLVTHILARPKGDESAVHMLKEQPALKIKVEAEAA